MQLGCFGHAASASGSKESAEPSIPWSPAYHVGSDDSSINRPPDGGESHRGSKFFPHMKGPASSPSAPAGCTVRTASGMPNWTDVPVARDSPGERQAAIAALDIEGGEKVPWTRCVDTEQKTPKTDEGGGQPSGLKLMTGERRVRSFWKRSARQTAIYTCLYKQLWGASTIEQFWSCFLIFMFCACFMLCCAREVLLITISQRSLNSNIHKGNQPLCLG